eukprot:CAMPEP_0175698746 /NCGR_PEP_ID=MMETSP0097-20121207/34127_1 /TAXON_ID=311494 /ORGANISM="Alexandrium monilatum, Strain CCMP3105" /LENGTH=177 /DNA_ID=CAMNT_0017005947 /DNA_START=53 /DNA_END=586 /DNA_ORIENTATION=-
MQRQGRWAAQAAFAATILSILAPAADIGAEAGHKSDDALDELNAVMLLQKGFQTLDAVVSEAAREVAPALAEKAQRPASRRGASAASSGRGADPPSKLLVLSQERSRVNASTATVLLIVGGVLLVLAFACAMYECSGRQDVKSSTSRSGPRDMARAEKLLREDRRQVPLPMPEETSD